LAGELLLVSLETIKRQLCELKPVLKAKYNVETMAIFGSYARSEQTQKSDLDLLITFSKPYNIWEFIDVKEFLTKKLHVKVDLVPKDSMKPMLKDQILQEATPI
jgi:predicted nucleotidyltransferase